MCDLGPREACDLQLGCQALTLELGHGVRQRGLHLVGAIQQQKDRGDVGQAWGDVAQQLEAVVVTPLQVVEDHEQRLLVRQLGEQPHHVAEESPAFLFGSDAG